MEFLKGQLKDTEVLIVEARQYQQENSRVVVPWVFGFTEDARVANRESRLRKPKVLGSVRLPRYKYISCGFQREAFAEENTSACTRRGNLSHRTT